MAVSGRLLTVAVREQISTVGTEADIGRSTPCETYGDTDIRHPKPTEHSGLAADVPHGLLDRKRRGTPKGSAAPALMLVYAVE